MDTFEMSPLTVALREVIDGSGLFQREIARRALVDPATISRIRTGQSLPDARTVQALALACGLSETEIAPLIALRLRERVARDKQESKALLTPLSHGRKKRLSQSHEREADAQMQSAELRENFYRLNIRQKDPFRSSS